MEPCAAPEASKESDFDLTGMNKLLHCMGHLKLSLRSIQDMNPETAFFSREDVNVSNSDYSMESNKFCESAIKAMKQQKTDLTNKSNASESLIELEMIANNLEKELQRIRSHYQSAFPKNMKNFDS